MGMGVSAVSGVSYYMLGSVTVSSVNTDTTSAILGAIPDAILGLLLWKQSIVV